MATEASRNILIKKAKKVVLLSSTKMKGYDQPVQSHSQCSFSVFLEWGRYMKLGKSVRKWKLGKVETCLNALKYSKQELR